MPYIYRYCDKTDHLFKYIGISRDKVRLENRFHSHKNDYWYKLGNWSIDYAFVKSKCDVEFLEGWLIAEYDTARFYNVKKADWGKSSMFLLPHLSWVKYEEGQSTNDSNDRYWAKQFTEMNNSLRQMRVQLRHEQTEKAQLMETVAKWKPHIAFLEGKNENLDQSVKKLESDNKDLERKVDLLTSALEKERERNKTLSESYKRAACVSAASSLMQRSAKK